MLTSYSIAFFIIESLWKTHYIGYVNILVKKNSKWLVVQKENFLNSDTAEKTIIYYYWPQLVIIKNDMSMKTWFETLKILNTKKNIM